MTPRKHVLFVCAANSCRGRMAQAWAQRLLDDQIEAHSAGIVPRRLDPYRALRDRIRAFIEKLPYRLGLR